MGMTPVPPTHFLVLGSAVSLVLAALGLVASFFHLGRPERAWRSAREVAHVMAARAR
jgi:DMSO reductase anchor subunit